MSTVGGAALTVIDSETAGVSLMLTVLVLSTSTGTLTRVLPSPASEAVTVYVSGGSF